MVLCRLTSSCAKSGTTRAALPHYGGSSRPQPPHQLTGVDAKGVSNPDEVPDRQVDLAALDVPDVRAVQPGLVGQALLGECWHQGFPVTADAPANLPGLIDAAFGAGHARKPRSLALHTSTA